MSISKAVYVIHAGDATLHLNSLKDILQEFIEEERIGNYSILESTSLSTGSLDTIGGKDMVIVLLTNGILAKRGIIRELLDILKERQRDCKIAEIIVDNIPYEPEFIAFPSDLLPIRSRTDMDAVWNGIRKNLSDLFPKPEVHPNPVPVPVPEKKSSLRQFLEKPHLMFLISVPVIFMIGLATASTISTTDMALSSDLKFITKILVIIFMVIGVIYWVMWKLGRQVSVKLNVIHILLTLGGLMLIRMISLLYDDWKDEIGVILIIIFLGQLIFPINFIYGLKRKRG